MRFNMPCGATSVMLTINYASIQMLLLFSLVVAPVFLSLPENLTVIAPEDATFFCEATARPGPDITWWRVEEGVHVQLINGINYTIVEGASISLSDPVVNQPATSNDVYQVIRTVTTDDTDTYTCVAGRESGTVL